MSKKNLYISQSNSDAIALLNLIANDSAEVIIFCVSSKSNYILFSEFGFEVYYLQRRNLGLFFVFTMFIDLRNAKNFLIEKVFSFDKVFFTSINYDWLSCYIINNFYKNSTKYYIQVLDNFTANQESRIFSTKKMFLCLYLYFLTKMKFDTYLNINSPKCKLDSRKVIPIQYEPLVATKYLYNLKKSYGNVVLFISNHEFGMFSKKSKQIFFDLLSDLKLKYNVYIKFHPRHGRICELLDKGFEEIPFHIPGELINYNQVNFVFGLATAAFAYPAKIYLKTCVSLIKFCEIEALYDQIPYLNEITENKICYEPSI